ncbi:MAG: exodeoxyribonuclease III [Magnetococcales bacterium]|nr:exodeoxyribonuclease III [Magnetococcales bacterium]
MRIATWNVNSLNVRLEPLLAWLRDDPVDVICLQETKLPDERFPAEALAAAGYRVWFAGQKTYNGVAILSRREGRGAIRRIPGWADEQQRFLSVEIDGIRVLCVYVPNGAEVGGEKYAYKLSWLKALTAHVETLLAEGGPVIVAGDFNIAPEDRDCYDPAAWAGQILVSEAERAAFRALLQGPLVDGLRQVDPRQGVYTWWDYRAGAFPRNHGLRIDHLLLSTDLARRLRRGEVLRGLRGMERPSDHAPVLLELA